MLMKCHDDTKTPLPQSKIGMTDTVMFTKDVYILSSYSLDNMFIDLSFFHPIIQNLFCVSICMCSRYKLP